MADKIMAIGIVVLICALLVWRVWRVLSGKSTGCGCASDSCPMLQSDKEYIDKPRHCKSPAIVTDDGNQSMEGKQE